MVHMYTCIVLLSGGYVVDHVYVQFTAGGMDTSSNVHECLLFHYSEYPHINQIVIMNYGFFICRTNMVQIFSIIPGEV